MIDLSSGHEATSPNDSLGIPQTSDATMRSALSEFLTHNNSADIERADNLGDGYIIKAPWGDPSLAIEISNEHDPIIKALTNVYLPEKFTGIWHRDTQLFEIIFTADPMPPVWHDLGDRTFNFKYKGQEYGCEFRRSSDRLLLIAERAQPKAPTRTLYRNLLSFQFYVFAEAGHRGYLKRPNAVPLSFWISGITWNDDEVIDLARHLNFYMTYYDNVSPLIIIHTPESESAASRPAVRFPFDEFPKTISARNLDTNLIHFWAAAREGDPVRRFIYCFQILEYAASYFIEENVRRAIRRSVAAPNAADNIDKVTQQVIEALAENRIGEPQKFEALLKATVDPGMIWKEIESHLAFFTSPTTFEGGFVVEPIAKLGWTAADFAVAWCPKFPSTLRNIRNALSHGRDQRMGAVITPTAANLARLQSWVPLIAVAAREVMVYREVA